MKTTSEYSNFGKNQIYTPHNFSGLNNKLAESWNRIKRYIADGNYDLYNQEIAKYGELLKNCALTSDVINAISEELRNIEIVALQSKGQTLTYASTCPTELQRDDIWISDTEVS